VGLAIRKRAQHVIGGREDCLPRLRGIEQGEVLAVGVVVADQEVQRDVVEKLDVIFYGDVERAVARVVEI